jgi:prophage regulatory protein
MNFPKLVRRPALLELLQISKSTLYTKIQNGLWPAPVSLGLRAVAWISIENEQMLAAIIAGQTQEEIKQLVKTLEENRKQFRGMV